MTKTVMQCDRCGAGPAGADQFDQCHLCGQTLCDECMAAGCCGQVPATSRRRPPEITAKNNRPAGRSEVRGTDRRPACRVRTSDL